MAPYKNKTTGEEDFVFNYLTLNYDLIQNLDLQTLNLLPKTETSKKTFLIFLDLKKHKEKELFRFVGSD